VPSVGFEAKKNDGKASMPEQVKRPNQWRKMMMMMMILKIFVMQT
jgi:hypothetical protein